MARFDRDDVIPAVIMGIVIVLLLVAFWWFLLVDHSDSAYAKNQSPGCHLQQKGESIPISQVYVDPASSQNVTIENNIICE
ncbi:hypothetical protein UFOVP667_9 [uncultured Caudovirales phage]|uniref:Uncharacterized protein n=1 Tax=uncultured Caudovirales phage TaxID=2100421 RepID=A0A6J5N7E4_9CAUD|nr:hypothetical protein UFOVP667_9 [uncultured Caudovirales phage]